jgi:hypothetical protein
MSERELLPRRRASLNFDFAHQRSTGGFVDLAVTVGFYDDGRIGEIFLSGRKHGTDLDVAYREAAILLSFALQFGVPLDRIRTAMVRSAEGVAEGVIGALLDAIIARADAG